MTPQEKAKELFKKYYRDSDLLVEDLSYIQAKECALIAVEEIINANGLHPNDTDYDYNKAEVYWEQVKTEIENL
jgi:hypothetical protein